jgi:hypothetical protein
MMWAGSLHYDIHTKFYGNLASVLKGFVVEGRFGQILSPYVPVEKDV